MAAARRSAPFIANYQIATETLTASGQACSNEKGITLLAVDATDAFTCPAPSFRGQRKVIATLTAANTPVATVAVSSCYGAGSGAATRTYAGFGTIGATVIPKVLILESFDGLGWWPVYTSGLTVA